MYSPDRKNKPQPFMLDAETYYWLLDTLEIKEDNSSKVNIASQTVKLAREHKMALENGIYFGAIMQKLRKVIIKK